MGFFFTNQQKKRFADVDLLRRMGCRLCDLYSSCAITKDMQPTGSINPYIYILGQSPGKDEDLQGSPFIGPSGQFLRSKFSYEQIKNARFNNVIRTRPPRDREASFEETESCRISVENDILLTRPKAIFAFGGAAVNWFLNLDTPPSINAWRGHRFPAQIKDHKFWVFPMLHPAYLLRGAMHLEHVFELDIKNAYRFLERKLEPLIVDPADIFNKAHLCYDLDSIRKGLVKLSKEPVIEVDLETNAIRPYKQGAKILSMALGTKDFTIAFGWKHPQAKWDKDSFSLLKRIVHTFLRNKKQVKFAHNASFEQEWLVNEFDDPELCRCSWRDSMSTAYCLGLGGNAKPTEGGAEKLFKGLLSLDNLSRIYLGFFLKAQSNLDRTNLERTPLAEVLKYDAGDVIAGHMIAEKLDEDVKFEGLESIVAEHDRRIPSVVLMQRKGMTLSEDRVRGHLSRLKSQVAKVYNIIYGHQDILKYESKYSKFDVGSWQDVAKFFEWLGFNVTKIDKGGKESKSSDNEILKAIEHPVAKAILEYRELDRLRTTYLDPLLPNTKNYVVYPDTLIHPNYTSHFTTTGRLSANSPNCFPPQVEVLTNLGWLRWDELPANIKLAQYDLSTSEINFTIPNEFISYNFDGELISITTDFHLDILCTPDHDFYVKSKQTGKIRKVHANEFPFWDKIAQAGYYKSGTVQLRKSQLILLAALQADGYYQVKDGYIEWCFTRTRKISRLREALTEENIIFSEGIHHKDRGDTKFYIAKRNIPDWLKGQKHFGPWILDLDEESFKFLASEIWLWDGGVHENDYCTADKIDIDWAQILLTLSGRASTTRTRESNTATFVTARHTDYCYTSNHNKQTIPYNGLVYCATMPKGTLIVRHNGRAVIAGNCQNWPKKKHKEIRDVFIAPPDHIIASCDYGQLEYRGLVIASQDPVLIKYVEQNRDIHSEASIKIARAYPKRVGNQSIVDRWLASDITNLKDEDKLFKAFRDIVKNNWVFALLYGAGDKKVSEAMGLPMNVVIPLREEFWAEFGGVKKWHERARAFYKEHGYIETLTKRRRYAYMESGEITNQPIQGVCADIVMNGMNKLSEWAISSNNHWALPIAMIHDDLTFYLSKDTWRVNLKHIVKTMLTCDYNFAKIIPLAIEASAGLDWAHQKGVGTFTSDKLDQIEIPDIDFA